MNSLFCNTKPKYECFPFIQIILICISLVSCNTNSGNKQKSLFELQNNKRIGVDFINQLDYTEQLNTYTYRNFYNGAGVGIGDINTDGLPDLYFCGNLVENKLYLNKGNFQFEDITEKAGVSCTGSWSTGVSMADVNGDGWLDIYVCKSGDPKSKNRNNELFINNGDQTFTEKAKEYGLAELGLSNHATFFDYDRDGDLDCYLLNNSFQSVTEFDMNPDQRQQRDPLGGNKLFRNDNNHFTDVSKEAGIYGSKIGFGLGVSVGDVNRDGWMDIYVSNDFFERDYIYLNNHDGTFRETLPEMMRSISAASMGADMADINNDHYPEVFATDMVPEHNDRLKTKTTFDNWESYSANVKNGYHRQFTRNVLQLNNGDGTFSEIGRLAGVNATDWSWGSLILDMDNDGLKDIFVANGIYKDLTDQDYIQYFSNRDMVMSIMSGNNVDYRKLIDGIPSVKIPSYAFKNMGDYQFRNVADQWGLGNPGFSNGSAYGDLDNDGDLELVVNNVNMPMYIYKNETNDILPENHYLKIILKGEQKNTEAIGTKVTVKHGGKQFYVEQMPMRGYLSTIDPRPNLGLGNLTMVDTLLVEWPDDRVTLLTNVQTNQTLTLNQKDAVKMDLRSVMPAVLEHHLLKDISAENRINFKHVESDFNDFEREKLIYHMMSTEGPRMCSGDVNGDQLDDVYVCGAKGQAGELLIQQNNGTFLSVEKQLFELDQISEEVDCSFFDADKDGDLDLYVACGGNEFPESSSALSDRLYLNNGKGRFVKSDQVLPAGKYESTSCVRAEDFDGDGVIELFVGIRLKPFLYGVPVNGYLLENDGKGNFRDVTDEIAPELKNVGLIRDMQWVDVDKDGDKDIIVAGDWMPVRVFLNDHGKFKEKTDAFGTEKTNGWWNCITAVDLDKDGDMDFIAGNHGLNSRFKASELKPVSMYVNDFDLNGSTDQIICTYDGDISYPMALKHDLTKQIPSLEKKYPKYEMYKNQQVTDVFTPEQLKSAVHLEVNLLETSVFINDGTGKFIRKSLPAEAQFAPVYAACIFDYNNDNNPDILLGGNLNNVKPEVGSYDASYGAILEGNGQGGFNYVSAKHTGFRLNGEVRDIKLINTKSGKLIFVARCNDSFQVFKPQSVGN